MGACRMLSNITVYGRKIEAVDDFIRDFISVFSRGGGKIWTDFLGGGQNMKTTTFCVQKHKKSLYFKIRGEMPPLPPPQMTSLEFIDLGITITIYAIIVTSVIR